MELEDIWSKVLKLLENETSKITLKTYIDVIDPKLIDENTICLVCPSSYHIEVCKERCLDIISEAFTKVTSKEYNFTFETRNDFNAEEDTWTKTLRVIKTKVSKIAFSTYFELMSAKFLDDSTACIVCSSNYHIDICIEKYQDIIKESLKEVTGIEYTIYFDCAKEDSRDSEVWGNILKEIKDEVSMIAYKTYFEIIVPKFINDDVLTLIFPSAYHMEIVQKRYLELLTSTINSVTGKEYNIYLEYRVD